MSALRHLLLAATALGLQTACAGAADRPAAGDPALPPATLWRDPCQPECRGGVIAGVELYLVQPYFERNLAYTVELENQNPPRPPGSPTFHILDRVDLAHHVEPAPLVWLGYVGDNGLGGRARYWYFREGTDQTMTLPASTGPVLGTVFSANPLGLQAFGDTLFQPDQHKPAIAVEPTAVGVTSKLELHVIDLEGLQEVEYRGWDFVFSAGVRLARLAQDYNFYNLQPASANPVVFRNLLSSNNFEGAGPVLAVEARRPLGGSGLALVGNARGSVVFGSAQQNALFGGTVLRNTDANPQFASEHRGRALPACELELGVEYGRTVGRSRLFGQVLLVGHDWLGAGNASRSAQTSFREGAPIGGADDDSDIGFFGVAFRVGVHY